MVDWFEIISLGIPVVTVVAIVVGPIAAVKITRKMDEERSARERKFDVFRILMKTRQVRLSHEHVTALNLIELEFYGCTNVTAPYRTYIQHLYSPMPAIEEQDRYFEERHDLFVDLMHALGKELGYVYDKRELERLSYAPMGWERDENIQRKNAFLLSEILEGKRPFPISSMQIQVASPFPPPPSIVNSSAEKNSD